MTWDIKGITALVTGGASGLGRAMAEHLLQQGAALVVVADRDEEQGARTVRALEDAHGAGRAAFLRCDVTADLDAVLADVTGRRGGVDLLVNNAGVLREKDLRLTVDVNVTSVIAWSLKFYDAMRKDRGGRGGTIINVSSIYGYRISPHIPVYHASKFAVLGFSRSLGHRLNYERSGVRVVALCPGLTVSAMSTENVQIRDDERLEEFLEEGRREAWQTADFIGRGAAAVYRQAESGEAWLVEGERPAEKLNF